MSLNLADLYEGVTDLISDRTAIVCDGRRRTYAELDEGSNRIAHHLASVGVGPGDHVALHMRNSIEYVESLLGCLKIRAVPINVNYRYVDAELTYLYNDSMAVALIVDEEFADAVESILPQRPASSMLSSSAKPSLPASTASVTTLQRGRSASRDSGRAAKTTSLSSTPAARRVCPRRAVASRGFLLRSATRVETRSALRTSRPKICTPLCRTSPR